MLVDDRWNQLADILGIQVVRRNKSIPEITLENFLMSGWNMYATEKFQKLPKSRLIYIDCCETS